MRCKARGIAVYRIEQTWESQYHERRDINKNPRNPPKSAKSAIKKPDVKHPEMVDHGINELVRESISTGWGIEMRDGRQVGG